MDKTVLFPYEQMRPEQSRLIEDVAKAISQGKNLLAHAPTGLGKTIATLGPALKHAIDQDKVVVFLTSRHTQHVLAIKTLQDIKNAFDIEFSCCDLIGKKWMCLQPGAEHLPSREFTEYCKNLREDNLCSFYTKSRNKERPSTHAEQAISTLKSQMPVDTQTINSVSKGCAVCPYEIASFIGKEAKVVIADYNYIFNDSIREGFFRRIEKKLSDCILIVDEGHNLPSRVRSMMSQQLSTIMIDRAIAEAKQFEFEEVMEKLSEIKKILIDLGSELDYQQNEDFVLRKEFFDAVNKTIHYDGTQKLFEHCGKIVREERRASFIGSLAEFMIHWLGEDQGYCRTIHYSEHKNAKVFTLQYRCLDPELITSPIINEAASTILMSGTLTPAEMYADILGFKNSSIKEYHDPFSEHNRLTMVIEEVSTKFTMRGAEQYQKIATILSDITGAVNGNSVAFFPSYDMRNEVMHYFEKLSQKKIFLEVSGMSKEEKEQLLQSFKQYKETGAVLLAVASGSFGEGVDLPGDLLKCVVIVGIPLQKPDLQTKELIEYYQDKYGEGMNYGYIYPAITKTLQNAGRCIRSETDRGVIAFLDERYLWETYAKCFPKDWDMKVTKLWKEKVKKFFA